MELTDREKALAGICSDCGAACKPMTEKEIAEMIDDLGLDDDEFSNACDDCLDQYKSYWKRA